MMKKILDSCIIAAFTIGFIILWVLVVFFDLPNRIINFVGVLLVCLIILLQPLIHIIFRAWF